MMTEWRVWRIEVSKKSAKGVARVACRNLLRKVFPCIEKLLVLRMDAPHAPQCETREP